MTERDHSLSENDAMLAAEYALGVLQGPERSAFAHRLATDPALVAAVRDWDERFTAIADEIPSNLPSAAVQLHLEKRLFGETPMPSLWNRLGFWRGLAIASFAALVAIGAWNFVPSQQQGGEAFVARLAGQSNAVTLVAYYDEAKGELRLNRTEGQAATGRSFELWLIAGQEAPVSLGILPESNSTRVNVPQSLRAKFKGAVLAISDEPSGGSPTGAPTGAVLATGQLTAI